ncbi:MAG: STM3941 family protein [Bacteroidota bacterium]
MFKQSLSIAIYISSTLARMGTHIIRANKVQALILFLLAALLLHTFLPVIMDLITGRRSELSPENILMGICYPPLALASVALGLLSLRRLLIIGPVIEVNDYGIIDRVSVAEAGFIPWSNIAHVELITDVGNHMLALFLYDDDFIHKKLTFVQYLLLKRNLNQAEALVQIRAGDIHLPLEQLQAFIQEQISLHTYQENNVDQQEGDVYFS